MNIGFDFRAVIRAPAHWIACGFGAGLVPKIPGTAGTLLAFPLYWGAKSVSADLLELLVMAGALTLLCWSAIFVVERKLGHHDDQSIVADEFAAFFLVLVVIPDHWQWHVLGFAAFRLFDMVKPPPIRWLDANVSGAFGVLLDDFAATIPAIAIVWAAWGIFG